MSCFICNSLKDGLEYISVSSNILPPDTTFCLVFVFVLD